MFYVDNIPIFEDILHVVETLQHAIREKGSNKLAVVKQVNGNVQVCCPMHKGGMERKPSCGISSDATNGTKVGMVHCFTCGYTAPLHVFVSDCFGYNDNGNYGKSWLLKNFSSMVDYEIKRPKIQFSFTEQKTSVETYVTDEELDSYRYIHPYMYQRKLTDEIIEKFDVGYDMGTKCLTFPVWDLKGNCVFVARRSVNTKYFNYPREAKKPIYGLNFIERGMEEVVVCESIINALTCWTWGIPAVALIGTGSKDQYPILDKAPYIRKLVMALDPDEAGDGGTRRLINGVKSKIIYKLKIPKGKDVNDLTKPEFLDILRNKSLL